jgi:hypothetical protein
MAGYNSRFLYDQCSFDQNLKSSIEPCNYQLILDKYENDNMAISKVICQTVDCDLSQSIYNVSKCRPITVNSNANIEARFSSIGQRTDIENSLLAIDRPTTRCIFKKYHSSDVPDNLANKYVLNNSETATNCANNIYSKYSDDKLILVNARLAERHIVPTNNKMPVNDGYHNENI